MRPAALIFVAGCGVEGFSFGYPRVAPVDTGEGLFDSGAVPCAPELEPNGFETDEDYDWLGLVDDDRSPRACGTVSQTGVDGSGYFDGDYDYFAVEGIRSGTVRAELTWSGGADLDLVLLAGEDQWTDLDQDDRESVVQASVDPGFYLVLVLGASGPPTDYVLTVSR